LAKASRTRGVANALLIATFWRAMTSLLVPDFTAKPTQSSTTRSGKRILALLRKSGKTEDGLAGDPKRLDRVLAETRMKGYGIRDQSFVGSVWAP